MSTTTATAARWSFWFRRFGGERWAKVAEADTEDGAWRALFDYPLSGDKTICRPGNDPNRPLGTRAAADEDDDDG
ncbi:MAG TPA: hypothetical protein VFB06_37675 [Streptosporangiaceae bacterium]|nr:hypothetical protein [Streptosporangiaceae bacterium]